MRLDLYLVEKGFFKTRSKAKEAIINGQVLVDDVCIKKVAFDCNDNKITIDEEANKYVSRGGFKLEKALKEFEIDFNLKTIVDIGSSTGGFTDCALKNGAKKYIVLMWEQIN